MARPSPSIAIALAALVVAAGGSATAATRVLITGGDIRNATLTGVDVRNASLTGADIRDGSIALRDLAPSARRTIGAQGVPGPQGPQGPAGAPGNSGATAAVPVPTPLASLDGGAQLIPSGRTTAVNWNEAADPNDAVDPDAMHSDDVNPDRLTPPIPGFYAVHVAVSWPANAVGDRELRIRRTSAGGGIREVPLARQAADGSSLVQNGSHLVRIDAGASISVLVRQGSGAELTLNPVRVSVTLTAPLR